MFLQRSRSQTISTRKLMPSYIALGEIVKGKWRRRRAKHLREFVSRQSKATMGWKDQRPINWFSCVSLFLLLRRLFFSHPPVYCRMTANRKCTKWHIQFDSISIEFKEVIARLKPYCKNLSSKCIHWHVNKAIRSRFYSIKGKRLWKNYAKWKIP